MVHRPAARPARPGAHPDWLRSHALGEQCVLGFTSAQYYDHTEWIIAWLGALEMSARVTNNVVDRGLLSTMVKKAKEAMAAEEITVIGDRGYSQRRGSSGL